MVKMHDVAMLLADTTRSRIYIQELKKAGLSPNNCVVFGDNVSAGGGHLSQKYDGEEQLALNMQETIIDTLKSMDVSYDFCDTKDINSSLMKATIAGLKEKYIIYSGYGGAILKPHLFQLGKKYIHVHAGALPQFRGSTTVYYSILKESTIGATAIFLNEEIDKGDILYQEKFSLPEYAVDMDYIYEPWCRAQVLVTTLNNYIDHDNIFAVVNQNNEGAETYFIIHPVLKHLVIKKLKQAITKG